MASGGRRGLFKRPVDEDELPGRLVKAKPIAPHIARRLGDGGGFAGRDFVVGSSKTQSEFYGHQQVIDDEDGPSSATPVASDSGSRALTSDERNKLNARILKAELKGNKDLVKKLKKQLEDGVTESADDDGNKGGRRGAEEAAGGEVLLTKIDRRTGLIMPVRSGGEKQPAPSTGRKERVKAIDDKFSERKEVREMVEEERMTTAEDQIGMFDHLAKASSSVRADDDFVIDDIFMSHKKKRKQTDDREERSKRDRHIADHKRHEQTLDSCNMCIDSTKLRKHLIVAVGLKTYLAVPSVQSLVEGHCLIVPMMHVPSSLQLDEDVFDEMKIWRKGLVAMLADRDEDCVFIESAKNVQHQPHMCIECIPLPKELGDAAPIYFKKAISECEGEWSDNKKLIDLASRGGDIRRAIPKGFSYFAVDFGLQSGYAHVIEDEQRFPANFAKEIVGGMMDLDHNLWRKPSVETFDEQTAKVVHFKDMWKSYDWTERVKQRLKDSDESDD